MAKTKIFQFKAPRAKKIKVKTLQTTFEAGVPEQLEIPGMIQGKPCGSLLEWRCALALDRLGFDFEYQFEIRGGWAMRGGQSIDFLIWTTPLPTPFQPMGTYWHGTIRLSETMLKVAIANQYFKGWAQPVLVIWEHELMSADMAYRTLRKYLLRR